jgi:hypothetical protein
MASLVPITVDATTGQPKIPVTGDSLVDADGGALGGGGGGDPPVNTTTTTTTLTSTGETLLCNNSTDITVNLEAASSHTDEIYTIKKIGANNNTVTIDPNGVETIDNVSTLVLYIQYDCVRIQSDGTKWVVIADSLIPHVASMTRDAVQSMTGSTATKVNFDNVDFDNAGIADVSTNYRFDIKRTGEYKVVAHPGVFALADGQYVKAEIHDTTGLLRDSTSHDSGASANARTVLVEVLSLTAGDFLEMKIDQGGSTQNTYTTENGKPRFSIAELRK